MQIKVAERLRPFSHIPGAQCLLPGSSLGLKIFPALIRVDDLAGSSPKKIIEIDLEVTGPVKNFLVVQDLEKGLVHVEGKSETGFIRYHIRAAGGSITLQLEKAPAEGLHSVTLGRTLKSGDEISIPCKDVKIVEIPIEKERLSLGNHKAQDWELIRRRFSMVEIFPLLFRLGQIVPNLPMSSMEGTLHLLSECQKAIAANRPETILPAFEKLVLAGFGGMLIPRLQDNDYQGLLIPNLSGKFQGSPLTLLTECCALIRSLFLKENDEGIHFLSALPPEFHCGRMLSIACRGVGLIDLEWSKKLLRRVIVHANQDGEAKFQFQKSLKSFRLRRKDQDRRLRVNSGDPFLIVSGHDYYLDNFQR